MSIFQGYPASGVVWDRRNLVIERRSVAATPFIPPRTSGPDAPFSRLQAQRMNRTRIPVYDHTRVTRFVPLPNFSPDGAVVPEARLKMLAKGFPVYDHTRATPFKPQVPRSSPVNTQNPEHLYRDNLRNLGRAWVSEVEWNWRNWPRVFIEQGVTV